MVVYSEFHIENKKGKNLVRQSIATNSHLNYYLYQTLHVSNGLFDFFNLLY